MGLGEKLRNSLNGRVKVAYNVLSKIVRDFHYENNKPTNKQKVREKKLFSVFCLEATDIYHTFFGTTNSWLSAKQNFPWRVNGAADPDTEVWEYRD